MNTLDCINVNGLDFNPQKIGDLLYYEGPLLSHFQDASKPNEHYFYRWVDNDDEANRWLIFKATSQDLVKFFNKQFSELDLIAQNNAVTFLDLDDNLNSLGIYICAFENIPNDYLPSQKTFFEASRYEPYALELKNKLEHSLKEDSILLQLLSRVQNMEKEHQETKKILSDLKRLLETSERN
ncbi:MAG: hypothetical protein JNM36_03805 [Chitinophagales bacterium]|jgi:hypothetical protein|nr:hypothetical protein [Chitinophagales bacterium]